LLQHIRFISISISCFVLLQISYHEGDNKNFRANFQPPSFKKSPQEGGSSGGGFQQPFRDRFYKTPLRPKTFRITFSPTNFGQILTKSNIFEII
jgi:hypothetical protein